MSFACLAGPWGQRAWWEHRELQPSWKWKAGGRAREGSPICNPNFQQAAHPLSGDGLRGAELHPRSSGAALHLAGTQNLPHSHAELRRLVPSSCSSGGARRAPIWVLCMVVGERRETWSRHTQAMGRKSWWSPWHGCPPVLISHGLRNGHVPHGQCPAMLTPAVTASCTEMLCWDTTPNTSWGQREGGSEVWQGMPSKVPASLPQNVQDGAHTAYFGH